MMEYKETTSLESDGQCNFLPSSGSKVESELDEKTKGIDDNSGHISKLVHQFYFVKLCPTDPNSISKIKKDENVVKKMNQDIHEITESITKKMSEKEYQDSVLKSLNYPQREWRNRVASKEKILKDLCMALDELNFMNKTVNTRLFREEINKNSLNSMMLHGRKSLAEEKQILRKINILQKDVASFKSLEVLKKTIRWSYYLKNWQKLLLEVEQFQILYWERASANDSVKGNISNYESLKKIIKDQIKLLCDDSLENKRQWIECGTRVRNAEKELETKNRELCSLKAKLTEKHKKKGEAYHSILMLKKLYHDEILHYYQYCSLINKVQQLAEEKDVAALDEMSCSEVEKFMLEWNNNKAFRQGYEKKVLQSLERRQLSKDGRRRPDKSCSIMLL